MPMTAFPHPDTAAADGLIAVGGDLEPATLLAAYRQGIFPWPAPGYPLLWFSPPERGIIDFSEVHIPGSLARARHRSALTFSIDRAFAVVIAACAHAPRPGQRGTWITRDMERAYVRLHRLGVAHSVEAWREGRLVGGVYGVDVDGAFAAESMFYAEPNASKLALLELIRHLAERGLDWLDVQVLTPHVARLGGKTIARSTFLARLEGTRRRELQLFP